MRFIYRHYRISRGFVLPTKSNPALLRDFCVRYHRGCGFGGHKFHDIRKYFIYGPPSTRGGITECLAVDGSVVLAKGYAYCSVQDNFCYRTGRNIARDKAKEELGKRLSQIKEALAST